MGLIFWIRFFRLNEVNWGGETLSTGDLLSSIDSLRVRGPDNLASSSYSSSSCISWLSFCWELVGLSTLKAEKWCGGAIGLKDPLEWLVWCDLGATTDERDMRAEFAACFWVDADPGMYEEVFVGCWNW